MRTADATTLLRVLMIVLVAYLIIAQYNPVVIILIIAAAMAMDALDGFFAVNEASKGKIGFGKYISALTGNESAKKDVKKAKEGLSKTSKFGQRIDVAGDRAVEYILWVVYTYVNVVPLFVLFIIIIRHSFVDAFMASKGTSAKMKTKFARVVYSSNLWRGGINVVKFLTFSYLSLMYIWGYPAWIGYVLITVLVAYILLRGAAEVLEAYA